MADPILSVVIGTFNRRDLIEKCLESIQRETSIPVTIYVTDAGSTDTTVEYLESVASEVIRPIFVGRKLGQARAYNDVFRTVTTPYVCWLSDDNIIVDGGLDSAVSILQSDPTIGMVGLKVQDKQGPFVDAPYIGGVSETGVLNVNQGVLPTQVLRDVGYFSESFGFYGIDPDLTAKVLYTGHDIVYTRSIAIHHFRDWATDRSSDAFRALAAHHQKFRQLYIAKYGGFGRWDMAWHVKRGTWWWLRKVLGRRYSIHSRKAVFGQITRDWNNILAGRHISLFDGIRHRGQPYHLRQHAGPFARTLRVLDDSCLAQVLEAGSDGPPRAHRHLKWTREILGFNDFFKTLFSQTPAPGTTDPGRVAPESWTGAYDLPDWARLIAADPASARALQKGHGTRPKILIATAVGGHGPATVVESTVAAALALRGADVHVLLCDGRLPGCLRVTINNLPDPQILENYELPRKACGDCQSRGTAAFEGLGLNVHHIGDWITDDEAAQARQMASKVPVRDIAGLTFEGMAIGEHACAGALRYFARGDLDGEPKGEVVLRRYLEASYITALAMQKLLKSHAFDTACFHHGLYVPQGIIGEACRHHNVRVANWCVSYRRNTVIFSHDDTYHHTLLDEPITQWADMPWAHADEISIDDYLKSRWHGSRDWIYFHENPEDDFTDYAHKAGIDLDRPCIGLLTNVMWDAQLHYKANAFPNMLSWVLQSIEYFSGRPELQLVIRVHPAEIRGTVPSRQPLMAEIEKAFPKLPANVFIILPEENVSTYAAMSHCSAAIIYGTKMGVELSSIGMPVIVAGEAWIRNKGVTRDASSPEKYFSILDELPFSDTMSPDTLTRAKKYAYHFFFRRMIPLPFLEPATTKAGFELKIGGLQELGPGHWPGLDIICEGILNGTPFVYPAERLGLHDGSKTPEETTADAR